MEKIRLTEPAPQEVDIVAKDQSDVVELHPGVWVDPHHTNLERLASLSERELTIAQQLVDGLTTEDAARTLYISRNTFRTHVKNILRKLDLHSSLGLVSLSVECGLRPSRLARPLDHSQHDAA